MNKTSKLNLNKSNLNLNLSSSLRIKQGSHGSDHVKRVVKLAKYIAEKEGANVEVVVTAAKLHDIARFVEKQASSNSQPNHAIESAKIARKILREANKDEKFIEQVVHCIESHSFTSGIKPRTIEAKVLSDADKLDAIGAIGVARTFMYAGEHGKTIEDAIKHFEEKLLHLHELIETETGKKLAKERHEFLLQFYKKIKEELELNFYF